MRSLYKSPPDELRISVLGALTASRDALVAALALHTAHIGAAHHITPQAGGDVTLLLGLSQANALADNAADLADQALRCQLNTALQPYQVLYGGLDEQLAQAVRILDVHQRKGACEPVPNTPPQTAAAPWQWACDNCSDPACERKLLSDLLAQRTFPA